MPYRFRVSLVKRCPPVKESRTWFIASLTAIVHRDVCDFLRFYLLMNVAQCSTADTSAPARLVERR